MKKTPVTFLAHRNDLDGHEDIFAFFPAEIYNSNGDETLRMSYSHIGQHCACSIEYAKESRAATKDEYLPLKTELESIGYKLQIISLSPSSPLPLINQ